MQEIGNKTQNNIDTSSFAFFYSSFNNKTVKP